MTTWKVWDVILKGLDTRSPNDALILTLPSGEMNLPVSARSNTFVKIDGHDEWGLLHAPSTFNLGHVSTIKILGGLPMVKADEQFTGFDLRVLPSGSTILQPGIVPVRSDLYNEADIRKLRDVVYGQLNHDVPQSPLAFVRTCLTKQMSAHISKQYPGYKNVPLKTIPNLDSKFNPKSLGTYVKIAIIGDEKTGRIATVLDRQVAWPNDLRLDDNMSSIATYMRTCMGKNSVIIPVLRTGVDEGVTAMLVAIRALDYLSTRKVAGVVRRIHESASDDRDPRRLRADSEEFDLKARRAERAGTLDRINEAMAGLGIQGPFICNPVVLDTGEDHDMDTSRPLFTR